MLPSLYKYDTKGKIRVWDVTTKGADVIQMHGLLEGKIQDRIYTSKGKNIGKSNETTPEEQAIIEAKALFTKKIKIDDYHQDVNQSGKQLRPMLAHDYLKVPHKLELPCIAQPKLDGVRGLAYINEDGNVDIQSRKGEQYIITNTMTNQLCLMIDWMEEATGMDITIDGEYYIHGVPLQKIVGASKKKKPLTDKLEFHIFDVVISANSKATDDGYLSRFCLFVASYTDLIKKGHDLSLIKLVDCFKCDTMETVEAQHTLYSSQGYEGIMLRQDVSYELAKRSYSLLKYKKFLDDEFEIIGANADKDGGVVWIVAIEAETGTLTCNVRPKGDLKQRIEWFHTRQQYYGKLLKVKFQGYNPYGNLEFAVGIELNRTDV